MSARRKLEAVPNPHAAKAGVARSAGSGVYPRLRAGEPTVDRARVVLCVLELATPPVERAASQLLEKLPWTESARDLAFRLLTARDSEAAARAAVVLARRDGGRSLRTIARHLSERVSSGTVGPVEARLLGAALRYFRADEAVSRARALDIARAQLERARTAEQRAVWEQIAIGITAD